MIKEINRNEYQEFWIVNKGAVFQDSNWLDCVLGHGEKALFYGKYVGNTLDNAFPLVIRKGRLFSFVNQALSTPFLGWVKPEDPELIRQFVKKIKLTGYWYAVNQQVSDWKSTVTYQIDLTKEKKVLFNNLRKDKQRNIKKAINDKISISIESDIEKIMTLVIMSLKRQNKSFEDLSYVQKILSDYTNHFQVNAWDGETCLSSLLFVYDTTTVYYILGGFNTKINNYTAGPFAMWNAILKAKEMGIQVFDFEGSIIPNIAEYFSSFGSVKKYYSYIYDYKWYFRFLKRIIKC